MTEFLFLAELFL